MEPNARIEIRLPRETRDRMIELGAPVGRTVTDIIREAIQDWLERHPA